jgi:hypothetical protein
MEKLPRTLLAAALTVAGIGSAHALNLNAAGLGQVLIYPYYTVNRNLQTLVSVTNATNRVKAVKVRFIEGRNSKPVLDFNLYLSPFDVWTGVALSFGASGGASIVTSDTSCTVPRIVSSLPFLDSQFTGANRDWEPSTTVASLASLLGAIERTREGHIEIIEMGLLQTGTLPSQLAEEATHAAAGIPVNCQAIVNAWSGTAGAWVVNAAANIDPPNGGLYGAAQIIDVTNGTLQAYSADAIESFYTNSATPGFLHRSPGSFAPDLGDADNGAGQIQVQIQTGNGFLGTETVPSQQKTRSTTQPYSYDAGSLLYMRDSIYNEFTSEPSLGAVSEWVVTMPTKGAYVDVASVTAVRAPFTNAFGDDGRACEALTISYWNREEQQPGATPGSVDFIPPPPSGSPNVPSICASAQVVAINQAAVTSGGPSAVLGSSYPAGLRTVTVQGPVFTSGWMRIAFDNPLQLGWQNVLNNRLNQPGGLAYAGLPVTGFWAVSYTNPNAQPGILAQYSGAIGHRWSQANVYIDP